VDLLHLLLHPLGLFLLAAVVEAAVMELEGRQVTMAALAAVAHKD